MVKAFVLINTEIGDEKLVLEQLKTVAGVTEAFMVYGTYDIICKVEQETMTSLKEMITRDIRRISGVRSTVSMILV